MSSVYVETSVLSYLAADPSRDLIVAGHQQITHEWWDSVKDRFEPFISESVWSEIHRGDSDIVSRRVNLVRVLPILAYNEDIQTLTREYETRLGLTGRARADLPHFAYAVSYKMDYLVTWNCKHIANGQVIRKLLEVNSELSRATPVIVTPEELLDIPGDDVP
ncbi:MAG: type II toxin-antitoxin system VapC family toxin [Planctomycetales bacterium]|nr:type II toxin-antitoxin system VapC family toxin [Planctomycetales bacterium]